MRFLRALIVLHRTYGRFPASARVHTLIRFLTCPFLRILPYVEGKTLLEIGAGHALFSRLAAWDRGVRAFAVEPDLRKMHPVAGVQNIAGYDHCIRGRFDCIAVIDVLYAIPVGQWDALLARAAERLPSGGRLLIKEQDPGARMKNLWNRAQEWIAQKVLRITLARAFSYEPIEVFTQRLEKHGFTDVVAKRIDFGYPHPHLLYVATKR